MKRVQKSPDTRPVVLSVNHVGKYFRLPTEQATGLKMLFINWTKGIKGYKEQHVLRDISFEVRQGDFFGIVGRNGSGKSTLLKLISGIYVPDSGNISVEGKLVPFIELGVGFNPELTGRENVYLNGALLGFSRSEIDDMYDDIVEFAELEEFMDQKLKNYSSGMQVRLAFSVAIKAQGDILVLDEVLAVGDEAFQRKCDNYFANIKKERVIQNIDLDSIYEVPLALKKEGLDQRVAEILKLDLKKSDHKEWLKVIHNMHNCNKKVTIAIIGKYIKLHDAYLSVVEALKHAGYYYQTTVDIKWIDAEDIEAVDPAAVGGDAQAVLRKNHAAAYIGCFFVADNVNLVAVKVDAGGLVG